MSQLAVDPRAAAGRHFRPVFQRDGVVRCAPLTTLWEASYIAFAEWGDGRRGGAFTRQPASDRVGRRLMQREDLRLITST